MESIGNLFQTGDWKGEKHVPVIHIPEKVKAGEKFDLKVSIGDAIGHPNSFEHYIAWFKVLFHPEGGKFPIELATFNFAAHGEGDNFTEPVGLSTIKLSKSGTIHAISYCNIHGLWENTKDIVVE
ncbi:superoxide reductase [Alkaliphilus pronyensis]|uniref:Superoxide reductase n=1 Tax=Alkaliphilus pronyensis TaxID=1482732 RepID=A0A6I0FP44_9FIRM|nr:class II SORL domain-containing protein [Alkaliphilus pronyensis]KAB3540996.1 superoxide reductase [Alkaliphilus pronyensis]